MRFQTSSNQKNFRALLIGFPKYPYHAFPHGFFNVLLAYFRALLYMTGTTPNQLHLLACLWEGLALTFLLINFFFWVPRSFSIFFTKYSVLILSYPFKIADLRILLGVIQSLFLFLLDLQFLFQDDIWWYLVAIREQDGSTVIEAIPISG